MERVQPHPHTLLLRNPGVMATARACLAARGAGEGGEGLKLLSFGCSLGDELASLKLMFPAARVYGCDIDETSLAVARRSVGALAELFAASPEAIAARGPFDLICAFSCLCVHPPPPGPFAEALPFARFEALAAMLAEALTPGGCLALYNASYRFQRTAAHRGFRPVRSDAVCRSGFVNLYDEDGRLKLEYGTSPSGVSVRGVRDAADLDEFDIVDCVFARDEAVGGAPIPISLYDPAPLIAGGYVPTFTWTRSELDGFPDAERSRWIDMRRAYRAWASPRGGEILYEYEVSRARLDGAGDLRLAIYGPGGVQLGDKA